MKPLLYCLLFILLPTVSMATIYTNQAMIEDLSTYDTVDEMDIDSVLLTVMDNTPSIMTIYPTEGYYYFWFYHHGNLIRGNLLFSHDLVAKNEVSFAYYYDVEGKGGRKSETHHKIYSSADGLLLTKVATQRYQLSYKGKNKTVVLNIPTSDYEPISDEAFLGNMQDESGVKFAFVFSHKTKQFYYLLDQSQDYEYYYNVSPHVSVGARTGFVYFHDNNTTPSRKILVGIAQKNSYLNNFYDGPFDQLPDHNLGRTKFQDYIALAYPSLAGKVDSHGHFLESDSTRVAVDNYAHYTDLTAFKYLEQCHDQSIECVQNFITLTEQP